MQEDHLEAFLGQHFLIPHQKDRADFSPRDRGLVDNIIADSEEEEDNDQSGEKQLHESQMWVAKRDILQLKKSLKKEQALLKARNAQI